LDDVDGILIAGSDEPWHPPLKNLKGGSTVIVMEEDPMRPRASYWGYQTNYCVPGDIEHNLTGLYSHLRRAAKSSSTAARTRAKKRAKRWAYYNEGKRKELFSEALDTPTSALHAAQVFQEISEVLPKGTIIVDEIIAQLPFMMQFLFANDSFGHYRGIAGGLGTGIPTALGLKLAEPEKMVVCVIGDGSLSYNPVPACFGLSQQYALPLLIIVCNNQGYASQAWNIQRYFPDGWAVKSNNLYGAVIEPTPDYSKLPAAFDGYGERVDNHDALRSALKRGVQAVRRGRLALLDILLEP
jgi:acetolactate synthase-1/2/3 large subunit